MAVLRKILDRLANRLGYVKPRVEVPKKSVRTSVGETYQLVRGLGFEPATVIDVGVASGTPELYDAFPQAYFLLVEPLPDFELNLQSILGRLEGSYVLAAAGGSPGEAVLNVHHGHLDGSSLYKESMGAVADGAEISVPVVRLDDVVRQKQLKGPFLIKVDVQGAELEVLAGASETMRQAELITLEVSLFEFMKGAPVLHDVVAFMKDRGFVTYDILPSWTRPLDKALGQMDIVFVKEGGMFRQSHDYATVEQLNAMLGN